MLESPQIFSRPRRTATLALMMAALVGSSAQVSAQACPHTADDATVVTRGNQLQLVIDADDSLSDADVKAIGQQVGLKLQLNSIHADDANLYIGWIDADRADRAIQALRAIRGIEAAEVNTQLKLIDPLAAVAESNTTLPSDASPAKFPNDPLYQFQWHFDQINMEAAWKVTAGKDVVVAVIDTGVAYADSRDGRFKLAPDLKGNDFATGYDFVSDDEQPYDEHGHGTHVAGTIAQTTHNGYGVAGVAYKARIMPLRVLNAQGYGSVGDIADSIRFAADNGAKVINMSLGGPLPSFVMAAAVRYAHSKGVTIVAAAGNSGRRMKSYPAAYKHVIAVAATQYDRKTTFYSQWGSFVDIAAPGGNTREDQNGDGRPDGVLQQTIKTGDPTTHDFSLFMGTSMASPHVAGVAAMVIGLGTNHPDQVEAILKQTANDEGKDDSREWRERFGAGIVDAEAAVNHTAGCTGMGRLGSAFLLALILVLGVRRRDPLGQTEAISKAPFAIGLILASSGLFILPLLIGGLVPDCAAFAVDALGAPLAQIDSALFGPGLHQNALLASCLIPFGVIAVGLGNTHLRSLGTGLAIGFAAFLLGEAIVQTSDVQFIPGI
ncbi:MAG: S8 family serine peptidase, partial [Myxococcota bacterium]